MVPSWHSTQVATEWMDSGQGFRWEVIAPAEALLGLRKELEKTPLPADGMILVEDDLTCISFAGGKPDSWLEVQRHVSSLLESEDCEGWRLRADGSALRILFSGDVPSGLPDRLHQALLPN